jgi:TRAP-type C4-dicarboxylate transport system permease small subunit
LGDSIIATTLNSVLGRTAHVAVALAGASIVGMAGVEAWQVFARYVLNNSPSWTEPVALLLMSTAMMLGAAAGVRANRHFGFFLLVEHASPGVRRVLLFIPKLIALAVGSMLAGWGVEMMIDAWDFQMAGAPLPQGVVFLPMCVGGALIALFALEQLISPPPPIVSGE